MCNEGPTVLHLRCLGAETILLICKVDAGQAYYQGHCKPVLAQFWRFPRWSVPNRLNFVGLG